MKRLILSSFILTLFMSFNMANAQRKCYSHERHLELLQENPELEQTMQELEAFTKKAIQSSANEKKGGGKGKPGGGTTPPPDGGGVTSGPISIPVYIHVLYSNSTQNISDAQIQSQIEVLNKDFSATNADVNQTPSEFAGLVADTEIQFTWSNADIIRKSSKKSSWGTGDAMKKSKRGGSDPIPGYLNMWVCNIGQGILGYAQFPGGAAATDGVVISPQYFGSSDFGSNFYLDAPYDKGRTVTHEVGHWVNLRHIWGDGGCGATDYVADTPDSDGANYGCPSYPDASCGSNDMTMNYMDYTDDPCMYMFTTGQKDRMRAVFAPGGPRASLVSTFTGESTTSMSSTSRFGDFGVSVFPNPASGVANVQVNLPAPNKQVVMNLINLQGQVISNVVFQNVDGGALTHSFNVSKLSAGVYIVSVIGEGYNHVEKLVIAQ